MDKRTIFHCKITGDTAREMLDLILRVTSIHDSKRKDYPVLIKVEDAGITISGVSETFQAAAVINSPVDFKTFTAGEIILTRTMAQKLAKFIYPDVKTIDSYKTVQIKSKTGVHVGDKLTPVYRHELPRYEFYAMGTARDTLEADGELTVKSNISSANVSVKCFSPFHAGFSSLVASFHCADVDGKFFSVRASEFKAAIDTVCYASSKKDTTIPITFATNFNCNADTGNVILTATDTYMLATCKVPDIYVENEDAQFNVPTEALEFILPILKEVPNSLVKVTFNEKTAAFKFSNCSIRVKLIKSNNYPNPEKLFYPADHIAVIARLESASTLAGALKLCCLFDNPNNETKLTFAENELLVVVENEKVGTYKQPVEVIEMRGLNGDTAGLTVNAQRLLNILKRREGGFSFKLSEAYLEIHDDTARTVLAPMKNSIVLPKKAEAENVQTKPVQEEPKPAETTAA